MKKLILALVLLIGTCSSKATIITKQFTYGGVYNVIIYVPDNPVGKYPTVIFFPGSGESGNNASLLYVNGPLNFIQAGWKPNFIIVGVQSQNPWPSTPDFVHNALDSLHESIYPIDWNKWYLTGLSYGAATIMSYMQTESDALFIKPAAAVPMSININAACTVDGAQSLCGTDLRFSNIGMWGFCGTEDNFFGLMQPYFNLLIAAHYPAKFTSLPGDGHCCWNSQYDPNYSNGGTNIYDWMFQFSNATDLPIVLSSFTTIYTDPVTTVEWTTASESNSDYFSVEQSDDGVHFYEVGKVLSQAPNGTSTSPLNYTFQY